MRLTDAGQALVEHAEVVIARLAAAEAELEAIAGVRGGRVRLSSFPTRRRLAAAARGRALQRPRHPEVELTFVEQEPEEAAQMLRAAELEVAIVFEYGRTSTSPSSTACTRASSCTTSIDDPMYLALPRDHPLARKQRVRLAGLRRRDLDPGTDTHSWCGRLHLAACAGGRASSPKVGFQSDDYNVVQGLIAAGVGISLLPGLALTNVREDIVVRSLGPKAPARRIAAAMLAGRYRSPGDATRCSTSSPRPPSASSCRRAPRSPPERAALARVSRSPWSCHP